MNMYVYMCMYMWVITVLFIGWSNNHFNNPRDQTLSTNNDNNTNNIGSSSSSSSSNTNNNNSNNNTNNII